MRGSNSDMPTIGGHPVPQSPMVPIPVNGSTPSLARHHSVVFAQYAGIGAIGTLVHFLILVWLVDFTTPVIASTVGAIAGGITNFQLLRIFVFAARPGQIFAFPKFLTVAIGGIAMNAAIMAMLIPLLPLLVCQAASTGTVLVAGFLLNSTWSFNDGAR